jgi:predicted dehydrogenase
MSRIGVAMLGHGFMGKVHSYALHALRTLEPNPSALPALVSICGRDRGAVERARAQYGWNEAVTDWREQVADDRVAIFDNAAPNILHTEPSLAAIRHGRHVFCEKPLAVDATQAYGLWRAARQAHVVHMCGFNYRFMPAVRLARRMLASGNLGEPTHFRARFLASSALRSDQQRTWRFRRSEAGSGALADIGSHIIDLARYLVGEPTAVSAIAKTFAPERNGEVVDVDDAFVAVVEFEGGALGSLEASRVAGRISNTCEFEVDATEGSLSFDVGRLNQLEVTTTRKEARHIDVTDPADPFMELWWPSPGHAIGWADTFTHEFRHFLAAVAGTSEIRPHGADFEDGYRCAEVCDAILRSGRTGKREPVNATLVDLEDLPATPVR